MVPRSRSPSSSRLRTRKNRGIARWVRNAIKCDAPERSAPTCPTRAFRIARPASAFSTAVLLFQASIIRLDKLAGHMCLPPKLTSRCSGRRRRSCRRRRGRGSGAGPAHAPQSVRQQGARAGEWRPSTSAGRARLLFQSCGHARVSWRRLSPHIASKPMSCASMALPPSDQRSVPHPTRFTNQQTCTFPTAHLAVAGGVVVFQHHKNSPSSTNQHRQHPQQPTSRSREASLLSSTTRTALVKTTARTKFQAASPHLAVARRVVVVQHHEQQVETRQQRVGQADVAGDGDGAVVVACGQRGGKTGS